MIHRVKKNGPIYRQVGTPKSVVAGTRMGGKNQMMLLLLLLAGGFLLVLWSVTGTSRIGIPELRLGSSSFSLSPATSPGTSLALASTNVIATQKVYDIVSVQTYSDTCLLYTSPSPRDRG